jgi:cytochrome b561
MPDHGSGYRTPARLFHWTVAILVLLMIPAGVTMIQDGIGRSLQNTLFIFHKNVGVVVLLLVLARLAYRLLHPPPPLPEAVPALQRRIAGATHAALYALLLIVPLAGYVRVRAGGFPIEGLDAMGLPALVPRSETLAEAAKALHWAGGLALAALVLLHVGAALYHGIFRRDGIFSRMWPPIGRPAGPEPLAAARRKNI